MSERLKPCPFTGKEVGLSCYSGGASPEDQSWFVHTEDEQIYSFGPFSTEEETIKAWNTRKPQINRERLAIAIKEYFESNDVRVDLNVFPNIKDSYEMADAIIKELER